MKLHLPSKHIIKPLRRLFSAVHHVRESESSAGFQPAVSPISNRQSVASLGALENSGHPQAGSTAIQQVGNLRYELVHSPGRGLAPAHRDFSRRGFLGVGMTLAAGALAAKAGDRSTSDP